MPLPTIFLALLLGTASATPEQTASLDSARAALEAGNSAEAESIAKRVLDLQPGEFDEATALEIWLSALLAQDREGEVDALTLAERCVEVRERLLQPADPDRARAYNLRARIHRAQRNYDEALADYQRALDDLSPRADEFAEISNNIRMNRANLLVTRRRADEAIPELQLVLETYQRLLGNTHRLIGYAYYNLARAYERNDDGDAAAAAYASSVEVRERLQPDEPEALATSHQQYAELLMERGSLSAAHEHFSAAHRIRARVLGPSDRQTLDSQDSLGDCDLQLGHPEKARALFETAQAMREATLEPNHVDLARSHRNLGNVAMDLGDWEEAQAHFEAALTIRQQQSRRSAQREAEELNNLAVAHGEAGELAEAEDAYRQVLAIHEQVLPPEHPDLAKSRLNLAWHRLSQGAADEARTLAEQALASLREGGDAEALRRAELVHGGIELQLANAEEASADFQHALELAGERYGDDSAEAAYAREWLSRALAAQGRSEEALAQALRAERDSRRDLRDRTRALPEREALHYREAGHVGLALALSLAIDQPSAWDAAFDAVVQSRALVLDELSQRGADDPTLREARERYSVAVSTGAAREKIDELRRAKERLERAHPQGALTNEIAGAQVREQLRPRQYLLAFALARENASSPEQLVAFLVDAQGVQELRELCGAVTLSERVQGLRRAIQSEASDVDARAAELYELLLRPFEPEIRQAEDVFVVGASALHMLPWSVLRDDEGNHLIEHSTLWHLLDAERDLVVFANEPRSNRRAERLLALGGPDFGPASAMPACPRPDQMQFPPLPGSGQEVHAIRERWSGPTRVLEGAEASEAELLRRLPEARRLHLATHGYFLQSDCDDESGAGRAGSRGLGRIVRLPGASQELPVNAISPLLRAGLALAGANQRQDGAQDNILTAEEIAGLDLKHVGTVVLSACDTGLGELQRGEGVLGLRRAFRQAGVRSVVMSLWPIDDERGREFMLAYYDALEQGNARALRSAQRAMLAKRYPPFDWAGTILSGDWR